MLSKQSRPVAFWFDLWAFGVSLARLLGAIYLSEVLDLLGAATISPLVAVKISLFLMGFMTF